MDQDARPIALRVQMSHDGADKPKGFKKTVAFLEEESRQPIFTGDIIGHVAKSQVDFRNPIGGIAFSIKPNRVIMPTQWAVRNGKGELLGTLVQTVFGKGAWALEGADGTERLRALDPKSWKEQLLVQMLNGAATSYVLADGATLLGAVQEEKRQAVEDKGVRGFFQTLITPSDPLLRLKPEAQDIDLRLLCGLVLLLFEITVSLDRSG